MAEEEPIWIEVHREGFEALAYFASEAKWHLKSGVLLAGDPARRRGEQGFRPLREVLDSLPVQRRRTSNHADYLRSKGVFVWPGMRHCEAHALIESGATWRHKEITESQIEVLRRFNYSPPPEMTRGEAADLIDQLFDGQRKSPQ